MFFTPLVNYFVLLLRVSLANLVREELLDPLVLL